MSPVNRRIITTDLGLLLMRIMVGVVFIFHGSQKLFGAFDGPGIQGFAGYLESLGVPLPVVSSVLAGCAEFFGGIVVLLGTGLRIGAVFPMIVMLVAVTQVHAGRFSVENNGMEYPLTLAAVLAGLILTGPGRLTLGQLIAAVRRGRGFTFSRSAPPAVQQR